MAKSRFGRLLLVEDDLGHARLIERNLRRAGVTHELTILHDGEAALAYLDHEFGEQGSPPATPLVILLDLNLPGRDGYQVLKSIKNNPRTKHLMVIMLTTTDDPHEVAHCYDLGCNAFITKPMQYERLVDLTHKLGAFLSIVTLSNAPAGINDTYLGLP